MAPQAHGQFHTPLLPQASIELPQGFHHAQASTHGPLRIVFMRLRIAKVDQQAIAQILGNRAVKTLDHCSTGLMVGTHHLPQVFRIELSGEHSRIHQVTEEDGELPPLGDGRTRPCGACQARRILHWRSSGRWRGLASDRRGDHGSTGEARPHQRPRRVILSLCCC